ncbi:hypothetical protein D3C80_1685630 [compost metagenome]
MNKFLYQNGMHIGNPDTWCQRADLCHLHSGITAGVDALERGEIHGDIQGQAMK